MEVKGTDIATTKTLLTGMMVMVTFRHYPEITDSCLGKGTSGLPLPAGQTLKVMRPLSEAIEGAFTMMTAKSQLLI